MATTSTGIAGAGLWFGARSGKGGATQRTIGKAFMGAAAFMAWGMADYMTDISEQMAQGDAYQERLGRIEEARSTLDANYNGAVEDLEGVRETNSDNDPRNDLGVTELSDANTREAVAAAEARAELSGSVADETRAYLAEDNVGYSALERASVTTTFLGAFASTLASIYLLFQSYGDSRWKARNANTGPAPVAA